MVFQSYALFPHYNVFDNVAYGLKLRKVPKAEIEQRVRTILDLVEMGGMESRMTNQLSGGQQQRVALARALVVEPGVLLFDEPLSNLDAKLRVTMRTEIRRIQQKLGITAIYVTHDQSEAMSISDEIIIMKKGVVAQMGSPKDIYYHPTDEFVADFIGEANFIKGTVKGMQGKDCVVSIEGRDVTVEPTRLAPRAPRAKSCCGGGHPDCPGGPAALHGGAELLHGQLSELPCAPYGWHAGENHRQLPPQQARL